MKDPVTLDIHIDGAARGNPGPASFAYIIEGNGLATVEENGTLGSATNNFAEYTALVKALERATQLHANRLVIASDSELLVKQMNGEYRVKNEDLRTLFEEARRLSRHFDLVTIRHVPRAQNSRADQLCNQALDHQGKQPRAATPREQKSSAGDRSSHRSAVHEEAITCLRAAATCWARGDAGNPTPEAVWDQLWSVLEEHGVLRQQRSSG